jgi:nucleoid-associated protein YgaU
VLVISVLGGAALAEKKDIDQSPDYAPKEYKMPNLDFSDTDVGREQAAKAAAAEKTYTVDSGDSLWAIAKQELGDGNRWREIYEANKETIGKNPDLIHPGMVLKIPS